MTRTPQTGNGRPRLVFIGHRRRAFEAVPDSVVCSGRAACVELLDRAPDALWVSLNSSLLVNALESWLPRARNGRRLGRLLLLEPPERSRVTVLRSLFDRVSGDEPSFEFLPIDELLEVLSAPPEIARDLFIGGKSDHGMRALVLVRGDSSTIVAPYSSFEPSPDASPDFHDLGITDSGHTVRLGEYEAATDAILYRADADFRRRLNKTRRAEEQGFGPSLRRLRKQLGMARTDFPGLSAKTIARIERSETTPRDRTLARIEERLGMSAKQIRTY